MEINKRKNLNTLIAIICLTGAITVPQVSWSQTNSSNSTVKIVAPSFTLTEEQIKLLDIDLYQQNYVGFEEKLFKYLPDDTQRANYLIQKLSSGHTIIYWILAEQYSKHIISSQYQFEDKAQIAFTKELISIALIMTEQDLTFCADNYARNGMRLLKKKYPSLLDFERRYSFGNKEAFEKAAQFVSLLNNRPSPAWVCYWFGDKDAPELYGKLFSSNKELIYRQTVERMRARIQ